MLTLERVFNRGILFLLTHVCLLSEEAAHPLLRGVLETTCARAPQPTTLSMRPPVCASRSLPSSPLSPITPATHGNLPARPCSAVMRHVRDPGALSLEEVGALVQQATHVAAGEGRGTGVGGEMEWGWMEW